MMFLREDRGWAVLNDGPKHQLIPPPPTTARSIWVPLQTLPIPAFTDEETETNGLFLLLRTCLYSFHVAHRGRVEELVTMQQEDQVMKDTWSWGGGSWFNT
ncbi:hypothetical protein P7K49_001414 [Saguinus oedipus]|uniref:Uncharacterized protein n=1 Tax=Saguinus oedipus TaxID=9490 RepID=A0ABQ9WEE1_SAGOE|nr:hypothetical protein P7K49_001414 [Saguinus oedipus]